MNRHILKLVSVSKKNTFFRCLCQENFKDKAFEILKIKEFTFVHDFFQNEINAVFGVFLRRLVFVFLFIPFLVEGQSTMEQVLPLVIKNNTWLKTQLLQAEASKMEAKTGLGLSNPEVEAGLLNGNPSVIGSRKDFSIKQSFDFPTVYYYRQKGVDIEQALLTQKQQQAVRELVHQTQTICLKLVWLNKLKQQKKLELSMVDSMATVVEKGYAMGLNSRFDSERADALRVQVRYDFQKLENEQQVFKGELVALNGGQPIDFADMDYPSWIVPAFNEEWKTNRVNALPQIQQAQSEEGLNINNLNLTKSETMPKFSLGFAGEYLPNENFHGVVVGITIPLFENRYKVKTALLNLNAAQAGNKHIQSMAMQTIERQIMQYEQTKQQFDFCKQAKNRISILNDLNHLLQVNQITLVEYIMQMETQYKLSINYLESEHSLCLATWELVRE